MLRGFTLLELLAAMVITTIIITILVSVTSMAVDTFNKSRAELRAARQARSILDAMAIDLQGLMIKTGNSAEWLVARERTTKPGPGSEPSPSAVDFVFLTGATDRYKGAGSGTSAATSFGDVSCSAYWLEFKDVVGTYSGAAEESLATFVMNRQLVDPDVAYTKNVIGAEDLVAALNGPGELSIDTIRSTLGLPEEKANVVTGFVCENVHQFSLTFHLEVSKSGSTVQVPVTVGPDAAGNSVETFRVKGTGIEITPLPADYTADEIASARLKSVSISLSVLTDSAVARLRSGAVPGGNLADFINKSSNNFTRLVELSGM